METRASVLDTHPTVIAARRDAGVPLPRGPVAAEWLKDIARRCGADDAGLIEITRPALDDQRHYILHVFSQTRTVLSFVVRMNREPVRSPTRSVANQEFHATYDAVNDTAREIVRALRGAGIDACNSVAAFPMEVQQPGRMWMVAHKPVAVAAGLGHMGIHRSVIHPTYGSFILLGTVLVGAEADVYDRPIEYNPCLNCNLCVSACPVSALKPDGAFDVSTCFTHNYREFLGNFVDWVSQITDARNAGDYRRRVPDTDTVSMWQSLAFKPGYKAAYCISVCPAGEDNIRPFLADKRRYVQNVVTPLRDKSETVYVLPGSDAEVDVPTRFPHKRITRVRRAVPIASIPAYLFQLRLSFQRGKARGLSAVYHWTFTGQQTAEVTTRIHEGRLAVEPGHVGVADVAVTADSRTWLAIVNDRSGVVRARLRRRLRIHGPMRLFRAFLRCFPG